MNQPTTKFLILFLFPLLFLSFSNFVNSASPIGCISPSTDNSASDTSCNVNGTATSCLDYCPGTSPAFTSNGSGTGIIVVYNGGNGFSISGSTIDETINCGTSSCLGTVSDPNFEVTNGQAISFSAIGGSGTGIGWRSPDSSGMCGEPIPATDGSGPYGQTAISSLLSQIPDGYSLISAQCWGDQAIGDSDFDFNDMMYVIAVRDTGGTVTPTLTPTSTTTQPPGETPTSTELPRTSITDNSFNLFLLSILLISGGFGFAKVVNILKDNGEDLTPTI